MKGWERGGPPPPGLHSKAAGFFFPREHQDDAPTGGCHGASPSSVGALPAGDGAADPVVIVVEDPPDPVVPPTATEAAAFVAARAAGRRYPPVIEAILQGDAYITSMEVGNWATRFTVSRMSPKTRTTSSAKASSEPPKHRPLPKPKYARTAFNAQGAGRFLSPSRSRSPRCPRSPWCPGSPRREGGSGSASTMPTSSSSGHWQPHSPGTPETPSSTSVAGDDRHAKHWPTLRAVIEARRASERRLAEQQRQHDSMSAPQISEVPGVTGISDTGSPPSHPQTEVSASCAVGGPAPLRSKVAADQYMPNPFPPVCPNALAPPPHPPPPPPSSVPDRPAVPKRRPVPIPGSVATEVLQQAQLTPKSGPPSGPAERAATGSE